MGRQVIFLTHAEVDIDPSVPVTDWALSAQGRARHMQFSTAPALADVSTIYASHERKAVEAAEIVAAKAGLTVRRVKALGENDRTSTGYLARDAFEGAADLFFARPDDSIRGWERARAAQARIVAAVGTILALDDTSGSVLIVAHGAVGALLRCHLLGIGITRAEDQTAGGGCWFTFAAPDGPPSGWVRI
jgi:broad specificity phosphatase PhoE